MVALTTERGALWVRLLKVIRTRRVEQEVLIPWSLEIDQLENRAAVDGAEFLRRAGEYQQTSEHTPAETRALLELAQSAIAADIEAQRLISKAARR